jgi:hypothetical protein
MELLTEITIENLVIGKPKQTKTGIKISPVYYKKDDGSTIKPVFQTPRVRVQYGARRFEEGSNITYCISFASREYDGEIDAFAELVDMLDDHIASSIANYRRSITPTHIMKLGLIQDKEGVLTSINRTDGRQVRPEQLTYGMYTDQYITLDSILHTDTYSSAIWKAHQIIVSPHEKVFLSVCLLDQFKDHAQPAAAAPAPPLLALPPPLPKPTAASAASKFKPNTSLASLISADMLKSHIQSLKLKKDNN